MLASVKWLNQYLSPAGLPASDVQRHLIEAGFPIESATPLEGGDTRLDVEITSNRGDCLSMLGLAREIAAKSGRELLVPSPPDCRKDSAPASALIRVDNTTPVQCPRFTARVIRSVKVGPSPAWLVAALESVGQRSINNVVDVTNYINFELGQPSHAFDLSKLTGGALVIRFAREGEKLTTLDGKARVLRSDELVVADAERAQGLAGVMGGGDSEVSATTTDVVLEVATWDPVTVRRASRRHQLRTDASHRYERVVDARTVDAAADRCAAMIAEVSGGKLCEGVVVTGAPLKPLSAVRLRPERCRALLGMNVEVEDIAGCLRAVGLEVGPLGRAGGELLCTIPAYRPDLSREVDLIEEVARIKGLDAVPQSSKVSIALRPAQPSERARQEIAAVLTGMGFFETITFSFASRIVADHFMPSGLSRIEVDEDRKQDEPALRPSIIPSLIACRVANQNAQVRREGGVRLFESGAVFAQDGSKGQSGHVENVNLALMIDVPMKGKSVKTEEMQTAVRLMRGAIDAVVRATTGSGAALFIDPRAPHCRAFDDSAYAGLSLSGSPLGYFGAVHRSVLEQYGLHHPVIGAELNLGVLIGAYPPAAVVTALPLFPGIERDVSLIVAEDVTWDRVRAIIAGKKRERMESWSFIGTFRGPQIGAGKKSMTVRMHFRDPARTLRHEEVDGVVEELVGEMKREVGAEVRA